MFLYEIRAPDSFFGSPFLPRSAFDKLFKRMGPYQGLFYQNKRLILHSPALKGLWPEAEHGQSWDDFLSFLQRVVAKGENNHLDQFLKTSRKLEQPYSDRFILASRILREFTFLLLYIHPTPFGYHLVLTPASDRADVETLHKAMIKRDNTHIFQEIEGWVHQIESEELMSEAIRSVPDLYRNEIFFQRVVSYTTAEGTEEESRLVYRERNDQWVRDIYDEGADFDDGSIPRIHARITNGEILMNITLFVGQVYPLSWISIPYQTLEKKSLTRFYEFVRNFSDKSAQMAREFASPAFGYAKSWLGQGYAMDSVRKVAAILSPAPMELPVIPIWGLTADTLAIVRQTARLSDPIFLDWGKGLAAILLRNCTLETAKEIVFPNLEKRMRLPLEPPVTVGTFLENN
jgi:hypothetical protein